ncbi:MAG: hypothetical protein K9M98_13380 [Cephaloticoccus sp.]|nr:hypothetical protein [Cephaloticoccus sp.]MCF7761484.1 hypothetical protein [Cephaloticoccus sp.]
MAELPPSAKPNGFRLLPGTWASRWFAVSIVWGLLMLTGWLLNTKWDAAPPANRPVKNPVDNYVSADSCRSCHPGNYASWHASFHRRMTQVASPETMPPGMDGLNLAAFERDYRVSRVGTKHLVRVKPQGAPDSALGAPQEIVLLTGSHSMQICWLTSNDGRTVEQFPFAYIVAEKMWVPMTASFMMPPEHIDPYSKAEWNVSCIHCHVTRGRSRFVANETFDTDVTDFGISCEACHSGGQEHITLNRDPVRRFRGHFSDKSDQTIANPARMNGPASALVCGQCHSTWSFDSMQAQMKFVQENSRFRPGQTQLDLRHVNQPSGAEGQANRDSLLREDAEAFYNMYWGDGMVRVTGREYNGTSASPCFRGGQFSCLSCHEMHPAQTDPATLQSWANDQVGPRMETNQACLQCHHEMAADIPAHTHHAAGSTGSSCYNCHMPHTTYGLLRAIRSHQISSPTAGETVELGRPNACNLCHLDQTLAWTAKNLADWYGQAVPALGKDDQELAFGATYILKGDAGQRALVAWAMGWAPAQRASGHEWLYPYLIFELNDPYAVVRFVAWKSLQSLPGFSGYPYDYTIDDPQQKEASALAYQKWWQETRKSHHVYAWKTLLQPSGLFRQDEYERLLRERNNRPVNLRE